MSEKAEATARRIEQSMSDLERQINWVTREASSYKDRKDQYHADYSQLLTQVPYVSQLTLLSAQGREQLRLHPARPSTPAATPISPATCVLPGPPAAAPASRRPISATARPFTSIFAAAFGFSLRVTVAEIDLRFLQRVSSAIPRSAGPAVVYIVNNKGQVLASSSKGPEIGKDVSGLPQVAGVPRLDCLSERHRHFRQRRADDGQRRAADPTGSCSSSSLRRRR